jgi:hypothetical protein
MSSIFVAVKAVTAIATVPIIHSMFFLKLIVSKSIAKREMQRAALLLNIHG